MALDKSAAEAAVMRSIGRDLRLTAKEAAQGILDIATAGMARTIRSATLSRGQEPARLTLIAYGGAGPLLGARVAQALGIDRVIAPIAPGTLCAQAILASDIARDYSETRILRLDEDQADVLTESFADMMIEGGKWLAGEGIAATDQYFECAIECRYRGQNFELTVPFDKEVDTPKSLRKKFHKAHDRTQGFSLSDRDVEAVTFRVKAHSLNLSKQSRSGDKVTLSSAKAEERLVHFEGQDHLTPILSRSRVGVETAIDGPAILEEATSPTVVPPGWCCRVRPDGSLELKRAAGNSERNGATS